MPAITLTDKIRKFSRVRIRKTSVKVPRLPIKKARNAKGRGNDSIPSSVIVNILIRAALEKAKRKKDKRQIPNGIRYNLIKDEAPDAPGGYGTVPKHYGMSPHSPYVNYQKIFGYLGKFKSQSMYENYETPAAKLNNSIEDRGFNLIDKEAMDKGARFIKYFFPHAADFYENLTSLVPVGGMNSAEWEQFKLMMQMDKVMYKLKVSTA